MDTTLTTTINWSAIHDACRTIDLARTSSPHLRLGYDGVYDAFGGTYFGSMYEHDGLAGLYDIRNALDLITKAAWHCIHGASSEMRRVEQRHTEDGYYYTQIPVLTEDGDPVLDEDGCEVTQRVRRWSRTVAARKVQQRVEDVIAQAQAAVRTMLTARPLYDLLLAAGLVTREPQACITAGIGGAHLNATGLRWLAGAERENKPVTIDQARAFLDGGMDALREAIGRGE